MRKRVYEVKAISILNEIKGVVMAFSKQQAAFIFERDKLSTYDKDFLRSQNFVIRVKQLDQGDF